MAKFIRLTEIKRGSIAINLDIIEVMAPAANGGTDLISITHHTKYTVKESMDDILHRAKEATHIAFPVFSTTEDAVPCDATKEDI